MPLPTFESQQSDDLSEYLPEASPDQWPVCATADELMDWIFHYEEFQYHQRMTAESGPPASEVVASSTSGHRPHIDQFNPVCVDKNVNSVYPAGASSLSPGTSPEIIYDENILNGYSLSTRQMATTCPSDFYKQFADEVDAILASPPPCLKSMEQGQTSPGSVAKGDWLVTDEATRKKRSPRLFEFLRQLLDDDAYAHIVGYTDKKRGIFQFYQKNKAAELWQQVKGRNCDSSKPFYSQRRPSSIVSFVSSSRLEMTYDKLARAIRYYYPSETICRSKGRFTFRFGQNSGFGSSWYPA